MVHAFSWKGAMKKAEIKLAKNIKIYESIGRGNKAADAKKRLLELKKRISETFV